MKLENALKKLQKLGLTTQSSGNLYTTIVGKNIIEFRVSIFGDNLNNIGLIRVIGKDERDDFMQDYCAGVFCDNLSQAIRLASN